MEVCHEIYQIQTVALPPNCVKHKNNRSERYRKVQITQKIERKR